MLNLQYMEDNEFIRDYEAERLLEIEGLKLELRETDYKAIKYAEGWISEEDYKDIKEDRQRIRNRINELENDNYKE